MTGGQLVAEVLARHGVRFLFTLCGGHISPILVACQERGIRVVDMRHESSAAFAADAVARLTGGVGVAAVTAGPGVTNTLTAVKNAQLAQSPLVVLGGATGTLLKGRGSLQDIDQLRLMRPHVKWAATVERVGDLAGVVTQACALARRGVPGPVFVECPVDLLYDERTVRDLYAAAAPAGAAGWGPRLLRAYLRRHTDQLFAGAQWARAGEPEVVGALEPPGRAVRRAADLLARAERPVLVVGSQALLAAGEAAALQAAVAELGVPTYLAGMARGLLGRAHALQVRHHRKRALREADLVLLAGVPCDFRLDYGRQIARAAKVVAANRSAADMRKNRRPTLAVAGDAGLFLRRLAALGGTPRARFAPWLAALRARDDEREREIDEQAAAPLGGINPLRLLRELDSVLADDSLLVADGGDFVATASYVLRPRAPLSWLDPGVFGTLGVGGGFAVGARLCRPAAELWLLWGDGSAAYSLAEIDTCVRHGLPLVAVVGNDAGWTQIAREQVPMLGSDVGTVLRATAYDEVARGYGGCGLELRRAEEIGEVFAEAKRLAAAGRPVVVNAHIGRSEFRKGSISM